MLIMKTYNKMKKLIDKLRAENRSVVIYGASDAGKNYVEILSAYNIPVHYFIDDDIHKQNKKYCGVDVLSVTQYIAKSECNETILIASYSPNVIIDKLRNSFPDLYQRVEWSDFYLWENELDYYEYYNSHMDEIDAAVKLLSDEKSKTVFENLLQYKISRDRNLIKNIRDNVSEQYFTDEIMSFTDREIFMDLGAYTGDTIKGFITAVDGKYKKIIAIEPDEKNFSLLKKQTYNLPNIDCHQIGVSDREGNAKFAAKALYTSCFDETGEIEIKTRTVDSILNGDEITFIKADIEGLEQKMLIGAQEAIKTYKPKIAIAVYHKKEDIFYIINLLHIYRSDYKFYLRHYTEMPIDTVLYAV